MNKRTVLSLLFCACLIPAFSQSWDEVKRNSNVYLCGEGWGATVEEADQQALVSLISKISVVVSSNFSISEDEKTVNGVLDASSYTNSKLQTYSSATLTNTERIVIDNNPDEAHIGRFIKRTELDRIFEGRIRTLKEYVRLGQVAEDAGKIDDALRYFYWAYSLLKSVQHPAEMTCEDEETGTKIYPLTWLPERMNTIFSGLDAMITGSDDANVDVFFTYNGNPVSSLDFTYFDGRNWSNIASAKNGRGTMEFTAGMIPENIQINYEYAYRSQAHINPEIKGVLDVVKGQAMRKARINLNTRKSVATQSNVFRKPQVELALPDGKKKVGEAKSSMQANLSEEKERPNDDTSQLLESLNVYQGILDKVVAAIKRKSASGIQDCFTDDGLDMFKRLILYGNARVLSTKDCMFSRYRESVVARSVQMSFNFRNGARKNFVEDVVFTFNKDKKIDCIAFGLDAKAKNDILRKTVWPMEARLSIMEFLENYKTAYALKRIDYLRTIFDDDAVIIVGHLAYKFEKIKGPDRSASYRTHRYVKRTQYSKEQYMRNLEACFRSNEFVNIRFANNDVRKAKDGEEYGIQIKQDYYSSNYGDEGYLYLQVDLSEREQPVIKVRTWQPEPDPEIGLFGIGNF